MRPEWTADQSKFIEWLATPRFDRIPPTQEMFAAQLGVDDGTLWRWKKLEGFQDDVNKLARAGLGHRLPEVYGALFREAEKGEFQHIQLLLELTGEYTKTQRNINDNKHDGDMTVKFVWADDSSEGD